MQRPFVVSTENNYSLHKISRPFGVDVSLL